MAVWRLQRWLIAGFSCLLVAIPFPLIMTPLVSAVDLGNRNTGPYVDRLVYKEIIGDDQQVQALINDEVDLIGGNVDVEHVNLVDEAENVEVAYVPRNGFGHFTINCAKYPFNITAFRRAFAYALDKERISEEVWYGYSNPHDCHVPAPNPFCFEEHLTETYYAEQSELGNLLLDEAGFFDVDADGFREAPDGTDFDVEITVPLRTRVSLTCGPIGEDALDALHIDAEFVVSEYHEYIDAANLHLDFDIEFGSYSLPGTELDFLETMYGSDYYMIDYCNTVNWRNSTYDALIPKVLYGQTEDEVREAAYAMQEILWFEQPRVICYCNLNFKAYRTDRFEGFVFSSFDSLSSWAKLKVHRKGLIPFGGDLRIAVGDGFSWQRSFNHMLYRISPYHYNYYADDVHCSLFRHDIQDNLVPWLVESFILETHQNMTYEHVPKGHSRFTFSLIQNATWSDGVPITASDVAFTFNYYKDSMPYGNFYNPVLANLAACYAAGSFRVVVELSSGSYWSLRRFAQNVILPEHVFREIGLEGWNTWDPVYGGAPFITSGPFILFEVEEGSHYTFVKNPNFFYRASYPSLSLATQLGSITFIEGTTGNQVSWTASSEYPSYYDIYVDAVLMVNSTWDGSEISYNLDHLSVGIHNYSITVYDLLGQTATTSGQVVVQPLHFTSTTIITDWTPSILVGIGAAVAVVLPISCFLFRKEMRSKMS